MVDGGDVVLAGAGFDQQCRRIAGDADEEEDGQRQHEQRQQRIAQPPLMIRIGVLMTLDAILLID